MTDTTTGEWDPNASLDPVAVGLIMKVFDSNTNLMYAVNEIVDMNKRIIKGLIKEIEPEEPPLDLDQDE